VPQGCLRFHRRQSFDFYILVSPKGFKNLIAVSSNPGSEESEGSKSLPESEMGETDTLNTEHLEQFVRSGRNGRRNAMHDLGVHELDIGAHKLAEQFAQLEASSSQAGPSGCGSSEANQDHSN
uniref:Uncharacterized protein n=1 Tax=Panagrolaimus sp. JU765 TaxID=591449 RepID=A0AC34QLF9_9BILA